MNKWKNIEGVDIPVYLNYGYNVLRFLDNGEYESCEIAIIKNTLDKNDRVLELGTGIGFVSAYCAKKIGSDKVFTYEGNPGMQPLIAELYKKNKLNPHSQIALLGSNNGSRTFYKNEESFLASSANTNSSKTTSYKVEEKDLNEEIARLQPNYLVMDIEGGEYEIMKLINFQTINKIQFELHPSVLNKEQVDFIFSKLEQSGFTKSNAFDFKNNFFFTRNGIA